MLATNVSPMRTYQNNKVNKIYTLPRAQWIMNPNYMHTPQHFIQHLFLSLQMHTHTQWHTTVCMQARHSHHPHIVSKANRDNQALWWRNYILDWGVAGVIQVHKATPPPPCFTILVLVSLSMSSSLNKLEKKTQAYRCAHTTNPQLCQPRKKKEKCLAQPGTKYLILCTCVLFQKTPHNTHVQQQ